MYEQVYEPIAGNLALSTLVAVIPILVLFVLLAGLRLAAQWASLITLAVALVIAVLVYGMPIGLALNSTLLGICFGLFPIVWIVINAIFIYNVIVDTGFFDTIRDSLAGVSNDRRIQVVLIAFVFGALLEATAGFGTPVAITASLMAGLGFEAIYAAALALLANTAPVAFGGFGIPILTGASVAGLDTMELSQMVGRQTPLLALIIPAMLVTVMSGFRRMLEVWPVIAVSGIAFAGTQFVVSNVLGPELADLLAALITVVAVIGLLSFWRPSSEWHFENEPSAEERESYDTPPMGRTLYAWSPFIIIVALFLLVQVPPIKDAVGGIQTAVNFPSAAVDPTTGLPVVPWPGLDGQVEQQPPVVPEPALLSLLRDQLALGGGHDHPDRRPHRPRRPQGGAWTGIEDLRPDAQTTLVCHPHYSLDPRARVPPELLGRDLHPWPRVRRDRRPVSVLRLVYRVAGVALTGSDTSSNALFANLQKVTAQQIGVSPNLTVGANSSGGVLGKMISPQNLAVGTSATGLQGKEGDLLRLVLKWSIALTLVMAIWVTLQAYVLKFLIP